MADAFVMILLFSVLLLHATPANSQFPKKEKFHAVKEDLPYIRCETCQKAVKHLYRKTNEMRVPAKKQLEEDKIIDLVEKSCNTEKEEGEWISKIDLHEEDGTLKLSEQSSFGKCRRECKTISQACEESVSEVDTDLAELLWRNQMSLSKIINEVCYSLTSACGKNPPKMKAGQRKLNEEFMQMSEDERKADKVLKQMRGVDGMPGMDMYSREDMEKMKEQLGDESGADQEKSSEEISRPEQGEAIGFFQIVMDSLFRFWSWLKGLFGFGMNRSEEL